MLGVSFYISYIDGDRISCSINFNISFRVIVSFNVKLIVVVSISICFRVGVSFSVS